MEVHCFGNMRIFEVDPPIALKPYIGKYFMYENLDERLKCRFFRALPNGMVEMFFLFNGTNILFLSNRRREVFSSFVAGVFELDHPMKIRVEAENAHFSGIGILFTYLGVNRILGVGLHELTNQVLESSCFTPARQNDLHDELEFGTDQRHRLRRLNDFFLGQLHNQQTPAQRVLFILNRLVHMHGPLTVERVAREFNISYKSLYRMFVDEFGLTPKMYLKILRFNHACWLLNKQPFVSWVDLVERCGYYDQSHFIHEFKTIMKQSPRQYLKTSHGSFYLDRPYVFY